jgi:DNA-directed RNA polymerase subunit RPC12/RpoP
MGEPAFYRCKACRRTWERFEMKLRRNPPATCPSCGSADQETDQAKEDAYMRDVYGPIGQMVGDILKKKFDG